MECPAPLLRRLAGAAMVLLVMQAAPAAGGPPRQVSDADLGRLYELLHKGDHFKVRVQSAKALGLMKVPAAVPHLVRALAADEDHLVRGTAAWALGAIGHPAAVEALAAAEAKDVEFVSKQAARAQAHIIARFPGNLPPAGRGRYHLDLDGLLKGSTDPELAKWLLDGLASRLVAYDAVDLGEELVVEDDAPAGRQPGADEPRVRLQVTGGIQAVKFPPERRAGPVTVSVALTVTWLPPKRTLIKQQLYSGTVPFGGGAAPRSELDEDPLFAAKKAALDKAVDQGARDLGKALRLTP